MDGRPMRPLRVGLLAYGLDRPLTGVTRVALELGRALEARDDCEITFLTPYRHGPWSTSGRTAHLSGCGLLPGMMLFGGPLIAQAARRHRLDLVHDPIGIGPFTVGRWLAPFARLLTLHDAIAFQQPGGYPLLNNILHRLYIPSTLRNVDAVATVGEDELPSHARIDLRANHFTGRGREEKLLRLLGVEPGIEHAFGRGAEQSGDADRRLRGGTHGDRPFFVGVVGLIS